MRDYSVEVEKQIGKAESAGKKAAKKLGKHGKKIIEKFRSKQKR